MLDDKVCWPSGIHDTTNSDVEIKFKNKSKKDNHLTSFLGKDGKDWDDKNGFNSDQRFRTYRSMYKQMGLLYQSKDHNNKEIIKLSKLGLELNEMISSLNSLKKQRFSAISETASEILGRYQLQNPILINSPKKLYINSGLDNKCDIQPYLFLWCTMRKLNNKIHHEEMNRVILHATRMGDINTAVNKIQNARQKLTDYSKASDQNLEQYLGKPAIQKQPTARISSWLSMAGWGGLLIENNSQKDGFRHLNPDSINQIDKVISNPPSFYQINPNDLPDKQESDWMNYFIGKNNMGIPPRKLEYCTNLKLNPPFSYNRIIFGAPGTGKSYKLNQEKNSLLKVDSEGNPTIGAYERVTFYSDYTYSKFVGTYKPVSRNNEISYEFVPGPFLKIWVKAMKNATDNADGAVMVQPYLLIIEEINRSPAATVFGDVFQLLDRNKDGVSEYAIITSEDVRNYLAKPDVMGGKPEDYAEIKIPNNMFIWATMNSADQGVFPMDTAFKRRWDFEYIGINNDESANVLKDSNGEYLKVHLGESNNNTDDVIWNDLRHAINEYLSQELNVNEDKLLGPFFISPQILKSDQFSEIFKSKVLMYLFEDAAKKSRKKLFNEKKLLSEIYNEYDKRGMAVFVSDIINNYESRQP